jgi:polysaccharide export outer membrane protein
MSSRTFLKTVVMLWIAAVSLAAQQTAAPVGPVKQIPDYSVGVTDVIRVDVTSGQPQTLYNKSYTVQNDGTIILPEVGPLKVVGLTALKIAAAIRQKLIDSEQFTTPIVVVTMEQYRSASLTVQGAVRTPGAISLQADRMLLPDAITKAGGLTSDAGPKITIKRANGVHPDPTVPLDSAGQEEYSKADLMDGKLDEVRLFEDDTVKVEIGRKFIVNGFVRTIGSYLWEPGMTIDKAVALAGGAAENGAMNRVEVKRKVKDSYKKVKLNKDKGSTPIEPEDIIFVPKKRM